MTQGLPSSSPLAQGPGRRLQVGLVGLGLVGTALTARLGAAGFGVVGFDHRPQAIAAWQRHGTAAAAASMTAATSLADLARRCRIVVLAVFDTHGVLQVVEGPSGLLATQPPEAIVDCSTGDPESLHTLAERLAARGIAFIEAPLSGSSAQIAQGTATMLLGASNEVITGHAALLEAIAPQRVHVGGPGMGARAKLATNLVLGLNRAALAEGMAFAEQLGITPATFLALVLATPARSEAALHKGERMVRGEFTPQSRIHQHLKDVELMLAAASARGQRLPLSTTHAQLLRAAVAAGDGELDNAAIVRQLRRERPDGAHGP